VRKLTAAEPGLTRISRTWSRSGGPSASSSWTTTRNLRRSPPRGPRALPAWFPTHAYRVRHLPSGPGIVAQQLSTASPQLAFFPGLNASPAIFPTVGRCSRAQQDGNRRSIACDRWIGAQAADLHAGRGDSPVWSPDGTQIALVSDQGGGPQIYCSARTGALAARLLRRQLRDLAGLVAPGGRIVFTASSRDVPAHAARSGDRRPGADHLRREHKENPSFARTAAFVSARPGSTTLAVVDTLTASARR